MRVTRAVATLTAATAMALAMILQALPAAAVAGYDSNYFGESAFVAISPGGNNQFAVGFTNTGTTGWTVGTASQVDLGTCGGTQQTSSCTMGTPPVNSAWASGWLSSSAYATTTTTFVGPGQIGWFTFTVMAPLGSTAGDFDFPGDVVLHATGASLHRQGYFQRASIAAVGAAAKLACAATPSTIEVGTTQTSTITVSVVDANGNVVTTDNGRSITLSQAGATGDLNGGALGASAAANTVNGVATFTLAADTNTAPGTDQLSGRESTNPILTGCITNITFAGAGAASALTVKAGASSFASGTATTTTISATSTDSAGVASAVAANTTVTFTVDNTTVCNFAVSGGTTNTAQAVIPAGSSVSPTLTLNITGSAGTCTVTASASGLSSGSKALNTVTLGSPNKLVITKNTSPAASTCGSETTAGTCNGTSSISVTVAVQDSNGNTIFSGTGSTDAVQVSYDSSCTATPPPGSAPAAAGTIKFTFKDMTAQTCTLTFADVSPGPAPNPNVAQATGTITFTGNGAPAKLTGSFKPNPIPANGASQSVAKICIADFGGNAIASGTGSTDFISYNHNATQTQPLTSSPQQAVAGCATFTVQSTTNVGSDSYTFSDSSRTLPSLAAGIATQ